MERLIESPMPEAVCFGCVKRLKDFFELVFFNPKPRSRTATLIHMPAIGLGAHRTCRWSWAIRHRLECVEQQVQHNLLQLHFITQTFGASGSISQHDMKLCRMASL